MGMPLWFGGEAAPEVQAEQALLDQQEHRRPQRRQHQQQRREVGGGVDEQQERLDPVQPLPAAQHRLDAGRVQVRRLEQEQREEQVGLESNDRPDQPPLVAGLGGGERERADGDVGIQVGVVGVAVVAVVLADPPGVAHPNEEVAEDQADQAVGPPGTEDLPVAGVMPEERDLGERERQEHGGHELPPGVPQQQEGGPAGGEQHGGRGDLGGVVGRPPAQEACLLDPPAQLGVVACHARSWGRQQDSLT
jgi:hypothetical protein